MKIRDASTVRPELFLHANRFSTDKSNCTTLSEYQIHQKLISAMDIKHDYFSGEAEVLAEIEAAGFYPITMDFEAGTNAEHWHDFDSMVYIVDGEITVMDTQTGERCVCGRGAMIKAPRGVLHSEETLGHRAIIGLSVRPGDLTQPVNKPPPVKIS
jgi:quercetin dioxygenase-like cupin family protein